jgi:hypothetical protein
VLRQGEQLLGRSFLRNPPHVHHDDPVGHVPHHRQVVGDEQVRQPALALQVVQQVQDLGLHRHVEGAGGFVEDDQLGVEGQGPRDRDPLALAAGELVRVAVQVLTTQAHLFEQADDPCAQVAARRSAVHAQRPSDDVADQLARVQRRERVLEDDLRVATKPPPGLAAQPVDPVCRLQRLQLGPLVVRAVIGGHRQQRVEVRNPLGGQVEVDPARWLAARAR